MTTPITTESYKQWALKKFKEIAENAQAATNRSTCMTVSDLQNPFGCNGFFDPCMEDNLISLGMCGSDMFLDWLGWESSDVCRKIQPYLLWGGIAPGADGMMPAVPPGFIEDCCEDRPTIAYGLCEQELDGFGHLGYGSEPLCIYDTLEKCKDTRGRKFLDGSAIESNGDFQRMMMAEALVQTMRWAIFYGDSSNAGQFDGLEKCIGTGKTDRKGVPCPALDSLVINWNAGCYTTEEGSTWTDPRGEQIFPVGSCIIDALWHLMRHLSKRKSMSGFKGQAISFTDYALVASPDQIECLIQCLCCKVQCEVGDCPDSVVYYKDGLAFQDSLRTGRGNAYGYGALVYKNVVIPMMEVDYIPNNDMYLIFRRAGNQALIFGEYQNTNTADLSIFGNRNIGNEFFTSDNGRFMHFGNRDNTCVTDAMDHLPRLDCLGSWMSARIIGFECDNGLGIDIVPSCVPFNPNFYIPQPYPIARV